MKILWVRDEGTVHQSVLVVTRTEDSYVEYAVEERGANENPQTPGKAPLGKYRAYSFPEDLERRGYVKRTLP